MGLWGSTMGAFGMGGSGGGTGGTAFSQFGQPPPPGMAAYQGPGRDNIGAVPRATYPEGFDIYHGGNIGAMPPSANLRPDPPFIGAPMPMPQQGLGGTTRRGSQILDAQGNVIGHYDDNNQPVYHGGASPWGGSQPGPGNGGINPGPRIGDPRYGVGGMGYEGGLGPSMPLGPQASTGMGMAPRYAQLGVPGSMQQSLYGNGLLRPAMPSMNNQSGY